MKPHTIWQGGLPACFAPPAPKPKPKAAPSAPRKWSAREERLMRGWYAEAGAEEMARRLGRSVASVRNKAKKLRLQVSHATLAAIARRNALRQMQRDAEALMADGSIPCKERLELMLAMEQVNRDARQHAAEHARQATRGTWWRRVNDKVAAA